MKQNKLTKRDINKIRARYMMIYDKYKDSSLEELKTLYNDKSQIKSFTDREAIVNLTRSKMIKNINSESKELNTSLEDGN